MAPARPPHRQQRLSRANKPKNRHTTNTFCPLTPYPRLRGDSASDARGASDERAGRHPAPKRREQRAGRKAPTPRRNTSATQTGAAHRWCATPAFELDHSPLGGRTWPGSSMVARKPLTSLRRSFSPQGTPRQLREEPPLGVERVARAVDPPAARHHRPRRRQVEPGASITQPAGGHRAVRRQVVPGGTHPHPSGGH